MRHPPVETYWNTAFPSSQINVFFRQQIGFHRPDDSDTIKDSENRHYVETFFLDQLFEKGTFFSNLFFQVKIFKLLGLPGYPDLNPLFGVEEAYLDIRVALHLLRQILPVYSLKNQTFLIGSDHTHPPNTGFVILGSCEITGRIVIEKLDDF